MQLEPDPDVAAAVPDPAEQAIQCVSDSTSATTDRRFHRDIRQRLTADTPPDHAAGRRHGYG